MHGHGKTPAAPACDAVTHEGRRCLRIGAASNFFFFLFHDSRWRSLDSSRFALNRADLYWIRLICANSGCISSYWAKPPKLKKKKNCKTAAQWSVIIRESPFFGDDHNWLAPRPRLVAEKWFQAGLTLWQRGTCSTGTHNCYSVGPWQSKLQYKKTLIIPKCPLLCILLDHLVAPKVRWLFWHMWRA